MVSALYLGVRLPEKPYERVKLDDVNISTKKLCELKVDAEKLLNYSSEQMGKADDKQTKPRPKTVNAIQFPLLRFQNSFTAELCCKMTRDRWRNKAFGRVQPFMCSPNQKRRWPKKANQFQRIKSNWPLSIID